MEKTTKTAPAVWGLFVGDHGDQLEVYNSKSGPFPPHEGSLGYVAIGWPAIGDLRMFKDNYTDFAHKFSIVYKSTSNREQAIQTNMSWYFAFEMKIGDYVVCPCSARNMLLVGEITGDYESDYHDELGLYGKKRSDFVHVRGVQWKHIINRADKRHSKLNRIGQLTLVRPKFTFEELQNILEESQS
jgi:hypothetical protein